MVTKSSSDPSCSASSPNFSGGAINASSAAGSRFGVGSDGLGPYRFLLTAADARRLSFHSGTSITRSLRLNSVELWSLACGMGSRCHGGTRGWFRSDVWRPDWMRRLGGGLRSLGQGSSGGSIRTGSISESMSDSMLLGDPAFEELFDLRSGCAHLPCNLPYG